MAETITLARPYARGVFDLASSRDSLQRWSETLAFLTAVVRDESIQAILGDADVSAARKLDALIAACGEDVDAEGINLLRLLSENGRIGIVPEIAEVYESLRADAEQLVHAEVISARKVTEAQQKQLTEALSRKLNRAVTLECKVDQSLIGGLIIRAGDLVIDGSVQGRLTQLAGTLGQ